MKTPAGFDCKYFYGDYFRGRDREECRLVGSGWVRPLCKTCPVPSILLANACEFMNLRAEVSRPVAAGFQRRVRVNPYCDKTGRSGFDAHIGCGECHLLPPVFEVKK